MSTRDAASLRDRARAILAAAARVCSRRGVATVVEVARAAGVSDLTLVRSTLHMVGGLVWLDAQRDRFAVVRRGSLLRAATDEEARCGPRRAPPARGSARARERRS